MTMSNLQERKRLRLKFFDYSTGGAYFATICTDHRTHLFGKIVGDRIESPLPQVIGWFKTMTTGAYIRGVKAGIYLPFEKHLWQRSYYDHIIRNEEDLYEIRRYIHENLERWISKYRQGPPCVAARKNKQK